MLERIQTLLTKRRADDRFERWHTPLVQAVCLAGAVALIAWEVARAVIGDLGRLDAPALTHLGGAAFLFAIFVVIRQNRFRVFLHSQNLERITRELSGIDTALKVEGERRRRTEAQLLEAQKMEAIAQLSGGIAHDFNNLLTIILSCASDAKKEIAEDHPIRESLNDISEAAKRGAELTEQLLTVAQRRIVEPKVLEIEASLLAMDRMLRHLLGPSIDLVVELDPDPWPVLIDPGQLEQVVLNLAINARDAMPGGGKLRIRTAKQVEGDRENIELMVTDTGSGMDPETAARAFDPFFTTKERGKGTGLGLASCYGIITQAGGRISLETQAGAGSTIRVILPRAESPVSGSASDLELVLSSGTETVLLVEDEATLRTILAQSLRKQGYLILEATSADHALSISSDYRGPIHMVVTDVVMRGKNGRELAVLVLASRPEAKVLFMSGHTDDAVLRHGISTRSIDFLAKPFTPDVLAEKIRTILDRPPTSTLKRLAANQVLSGSPDPSSSSHGRPGLPHT